MTATQKNVAAGIAFAFLLAATLWLCLLWLNSSSTRMLFLDREGLGGLTFLWSSFRWMVDEGELSQKIFAGFLAIIGVGIRILSSRKWFRGQAYVVAAICVLGIVLCAVMLIKFWDMNQDPFRTFDDNAVRSGVQLRSAIAVFFGIVVSWYVAFLELQLGITASILKSLKRKLAQQQTDSREDKESDGQNAE